MMIIKNNASKTFAGRVSSGRDYREGRTSLLTCWHRCI